MQTVVEDSLAKVLDFNLLYLLGAKTIRTMVDIKNCYLTSAVNENIFTLNQNFYHTDPSQIEHICIFECESYVLFKSDTKFDLIFKV